jgi:hypothetical protein
MNIKYISDDDEQRGYYCDSINSIDNYVKVEIDESLHQIINYPPLEKHSSNKIVSICNEIDLIDFITYANNLIR